MTETKALKPIDEVRGQLESGAMTAEIQKALPPHIKVDRFVRVVMTALQNSPNLLAPDKDRRSLYGACIKAASDGLLPDGKESALVPFGKEIAYLPMTAGILKKIRNSGELQSISAQVVHEKDKFEYWVDSDGEHINHRPDVFGERGEVRGVYAIAKTKDGGVYVEVLPKKEIEKIRSVSKNSAGVIWKTWWEEMAKKSAIRRMSKRLPMSTDIEMIIKENDDLYDLEKPEGSTPYNPETTSTTSTRLSGVIQGHSKTKSKTKPKKEPEPEPEPDPEDEAGSAIEPVEGELI